MNQPRRLTASVVAVLCATAFLCACSRTSRPLLEYDYPDWTQLHDEPITEPIPGHSSGIRTMYINPTGTAVTVTEGEARTVWDYPDGTVIIKEVAMPTEAGAAGEPSMLLGMIKDPAHPQAQGEWVWVMRNPHTGEETIFDSEFCITCHADANERRTADDPLPIGIPNPDRAFRDYVFYPYFAGE